MLRILHAHSFVKWTVRCEEMYLQFVCELEDVEFRIMAFTCDQGGANYGFKTTLGLTEDAPWIQNPRRPDSFIFFFYDWVHVYKNLRNNLLY